MMVTGGIVTSIHTRLMHYIYRDSAIIASKISKTDGR